MPYSTLTTASWDTEEFESLSEQTQIKLSRRYVLLPHRTDLSRMWFLERLLKLGTIDVKKEYVCVSVLPPPHPLHSCAHTSDPTAPTSRAARRSSTRSGGRRTRPCRGTAHRSHPWRSAASASSKASPPTPLLSCSTPSARAAPRAGSQAVSFLLPTQLTSVFDRMFQLKAISARTPGTEKVS